MAERPPGRLVGERLRALRVARGLPLEIVSEAAQITPSYLSRLENERRVSLALEVAIRLADFYGVSLDYLTGRSSKEPLDPECIGTASLRGTELVEVVPGLSQ